MVSLARLHGAVQGPEPRTTARQRDLSSPGKLRQLTKEKLQGDMAREVFAESDRGRFRLKSYQETTPSFSNTGVLQLQCLYVYSTQSKAHIEDYVEEALKNTLKNWTESSL